jgi:hypothetical protein
MTLRETYKNMGRTIVEQSENDFIAEVDASVYMEGEREQGGPILEVEDRKVRVVYNIDIEYRSYGIKQIDAYNFRLLPFNLENLNLEEPEIVVRKNDITDLSGIQVERGGENERGSFYPKSIELYVDNSGNILVEKSKIMF